VDFQELFSIISPRLRKIAGKYNGYSLYLDACDLYQEMCFYLWEHFGESVPPHLNENYIVKGCEFYLLNYLRMKREKVNTLSLEKSLNEDGNTLKDILPDGKESMDRYLDRKLTIETIRNNGFTKREKEVFSLILEGYTTRESGRKLGISHVMVIKLRKRLVDRWRKKVKARVTTRGKKLL